MAKLEFDQPHPHSGLTTSLDESECPEHAQVMEESECNKSQCIEPHLSARTLETAGFLLNTEFVGHITRSSTRILAPFPGPTF